jgi:hypothetical protein
MENVDRFFLFFNENVVHKNVPYDIVAKSSGQQTHAFFFFYLDYYMDRAIVQNEITWPCAGLTACRLTIIIVSAHCRKYINTHTSAFRTNTVVLIRLL